MTNDKKALYVLVVTIIINFIDTSTFFVGINNFVNAVVIYYTYIDGILDVDATTILGIFATVAISLYIYIAQVKDRYKKQVYFNITKVKEITVGIVVLSIFFCFIRVKLISFLALVLLGGFIIKAVRDLCNNEMAMELYKKSAEEYFQKRYKELINAKILKNSIDYEHKLNKKCTIDKYGFIIFNNADDYREVKYNKEGIFEKINYKKINKIINLVDKPFNNNTNQKENPEYYVIIQKEIGDYVNNNESVVLIHKSIKLSDFDDLIEIRKVKKPYVYKNDLIAIISEKMLLNDFEYFELYIDILAKYVKKEILSQGEVVKEYLIIGLEGVLLKSKDIKNMNMIRKLTNIWCKYISEEYNSESFSDAFLWCETLYKGKSIEDSVTVIEQLLDILYSSLHYSIEDDIDSISKQKDVQLKERLINKIDTIYLLLQKLLIWTIKVKNKKLSNKVIKFSQNIININVHIQYDNLLKQVKKHTDRKSRYIRYGVCLYLSRKQEQPDLKEQIMYFLKDISLSTYIQDLLELLCEDSKFGSMTDYWEDFGEREYNMWVETWWCETHNYIKDLLLIGCLVNYEKIETTLTIESNDMLISMIEGVIKYYTEKEYKQYIIDIAQIYNKNLEECINSLLEILKSEKEKQKIAEIERVKSSELSTKYLERFYKEFFDEYNKSSDLLKILKLYGNYEEKDQYGIEENQKIMNTMQKKEIFVDSSVGYSQYAAGYVRGFYDQLNKDFYKLISGRAEIMSKSIFLKNIGHNNILVTNMWTEDLRDIFGANFEPFYRINREVRVNEINIRDNKYEGTFIGQILNEDVYVNVYYVFASEEEYIYILNEKDIELEMFKSKVEDANYEVGKICIKILTFMEDGEETELMEELIKSKPEWLNEIEGLDKQKEYLKTLVNLKCFVNYKFNLKDNSKVYKMKGKRKKKNRN